MVQKIIQVLEETKNCSLEIQAKAVLAMQAEAKMKPPWNNDEFQRQARIYVEPEGYGWEPE